MPYSCTTLKLSAFLILHPRGFLLPYSSPYLLYLQAKPIIEQLPKSVLIFVCEISLIFLVLSASWFISLSLFGRTVLLLIRIILEYCQCVDNIPSVTTDMLTRLSDLLKVCMISLLWKNSWKK